eukprot:6080489-Alexandrium_andersonii.AAC.1
MSASLVGSEMCIRDRSGVKAFREKLMGRSSYTLGKLSGQSWLIGPKPCPRRPWSQLAQRAKWPSVQLGIGG